MADLKHFFERDSVRGAIASSELIAFKRACSDSEYEEYVSAAKAENAKFATVA